MYNGTLPVHPTADPIHDLLINSKRCPTEVLGFRQLLKNAGLSLEPTMVANRGYHNPKEGSFSLFEIVSGQLSNKLMINKGDFFFGHFITATSNHQLKLDQTPEKNALMIEAFAWDHKKQAYNFYELRGDGQQGVWYYRGDSIDIMDDNLNLHRQKDAEHPIFGNRLRCSACHSAGGPIMKELEAPNNDWWEPTRKLDLGENIPDVTLADIMETLVPAQKLTTSVLHGIRQLEQSPLKTSRILTHSLQESLRPIFCPVEINLASDQEPNDANNAEINIPSGFLINPLLAQSTISIKRADYEKALEETGSYFPETSLRDADHAWLTPVKAESDIQAINDMINFKIIDEKFAYDVLSIDASNPTTSNNRCGLLKYIPNDSYPKPKWQDQFKQNLSKSNNPYALKLLNRMNNASLTREAYQQRASEFLAQCQAKLGKSKNVVDLYKLLIQRRKEVAASEISKNPRGQILEPGFRVIFPETTTKIEAGEYELTDTCDLVPTAKHQTNSHPES